MRRALAGAAVLLALGVAALDLTLGLVWVAAVAGAALLRRRHRAWPLLALAALLGAGVALGRSGLDPPPPRSHGDELLARLIRPRPGVSPGRPVDAAEALRARLATVRREELDPDPADLARRAGLAVGFAAEAGALRAGFPRETQALDQAARRLALTLTSAEFRDLDGRRARLAEWLEAVEARLGPGRGEGAEALREAAGALEPAVLAPLAFRALRADLAEAERAIHALVAAVAGQAPDVRADVRIVVDDREAGRVAVEHRWRVQAGGAARLAWVDLGPGGAPREGDEGTRAASGPAARPPAGPTVHVEVEGRRVAAGGGRAVLPPDTREAVAVFRREGALSLEPFRAALRPVTFRRLLVPLGGPGADVLLTGAAIPGPGGAGRVVAPLALAGAAPPAVILEAPAWALAHVDAPGTIQAGAAGDRWASASPVASPLAVELSPRGWLLRNRWLAALRPHVYGPSPAVLVAVAALAVLAVSLVPAPPRPPAQP